MMNFGFATFSSRVGLVAASLVIAAAVQCKAVPILQLYIQDATYDTSTDTWVGDFTDGDTIRLWTIGNTAGEGGQGTISDVKLAIAYDSADSPAFVINESTTGGYGGFTDPSDANTASLIQTVTDGSLPQLSDGRDLPNHSNIYGTGTTWTEYLLGDFYRTDALGGDFVSPLPTPSVGYDINVYEITITGTDWVHFDLYDSIAAGNHTRATFAPPSHDAETGVPDGGNTLALLGLGLFGASLLFRKLGVIHA